jgi:hypothetical protein
VSSAATGEQSRSRSASTLAELADDDQCSAVELARSGDLLHR